MAIFVVVHSNQDDHCNVMVTAVGSLRSVQVRCLRGIYETITADLDRALTWPDEQIRALSALVSRGRLDKAIDYWNTNMAHSGTTFSICSVDDFTDNVTLDDVDFTDFL